jgi:CheY-like chemotaxis protein
MSGEHILVIDDDPDIREALIMILEPAGYRLTCCATGPEGLDALRADRPDLILLDVMLASPSEGFHVAHEIKNDPATGRIPIVMISAIGQTLGMDYAREMGSDYVSTEAFLEKPLEAESLLATVRDTLPKRSVE